MGSFRGLTSISLDDKGRMALPARYRELLTEACDGNLVLTIDTEDPCLLLYPLPVWEGIQARLEALPSYNPATRRIQRLLIGHATDVQMDKQGRVLLPMVLRAYARLDKQVALIGQGQRFELWDEAMWMQRREEYLAPTHDMAGLPAELSELAL
ncbi:cell division protein MraZ [Pokkaliibacter plantistimulans]|uniref:Transcriptional regulator MraZ n=2 Tax=Pseudomonadota TaxID=1224 RepID=A0ABX5LYI5_9GAMM|nr:MULTISPECIES: division/cell wall cluster transcriptional repressor MraZ [Pokkaliibacter]MDH2431632.1 division/cell wall cluster transcriptional repressor MraZ [Pokkaliibacter sp. MBI-7]PPC74799.1 cell division/cell wall cluster transcriptional repressor MraZ [Pokkaliibacter plantistimulans]PXF31752.1 cell division protein MraZ [Pokkaliibacter plantistimulans]